MSNQQDRYNLDYHDEGIFSTRGEENARQRNLTASLKSGCTRCCAFSYQNYSQITVAISLSFVFLVGILKIVLGSMSISSGQAAIILASQDHLHWSGIFLVSESDPHVVLLMYKSTTRKETKGLESPSPLAMISLSGKSSEGLGEDSKKCL